MLARKPGFVPKSVAAYTKNPEVCKFFRTRILANRASFSERREYVVNKADQRAVVVIKPEKVNFSENCPPRFYLPPTFDAALLHSMHL
jgi:hypothetical protein